jgi:hypothetical protein
MTSEVVKGLHGLVVGFSGLWIKRYCHVGVFSVSFTAEISVHVFSVQVTCQQDRQPTSKKGDRSDPISGLEGER